MGQLDLAIENYRHALELKADLPEAIANLVHTLVFTCDWRTREEDFARLSQMVVLQLTNPSMLPSVQPFHALVYPLSLAELLQIARRYAAKAKANVALVDARFIFRPKPKSVRLRIGYVSSDFGNHPLSQLMQSGGWQIKVITSYILFLWVSVCFYLFHYFYILVFGYHDKSKFEVTCYALTPSDKSKWRKKIESEVENFKDISSLHSGDAAQLIFQDNIHILINLNGYTKGSRNEIFALHPAPIQVII